MSFDSDRAQNTPARAHAATTPYNRTAMGFIERHSLWTDAQGKTHGMALLRMEIEVPDDYRLPRVAGGGTAEYPGPGSADRG